LPIFLSRTNLLSCSAEELHALITSGELESPCLTFAAEALGQKDKEAKFWRTLVRLLRHDKAYVREGAVYGLGCYTSTDAARQALFLVANEDPERGVREAALEMLDNFPAQAVPGTTV